MNGVVIDVFYVYSVLLVVHYSALNNLHYAFLHTKASHCIHTQHILVLVLIGQKILAIILLLNSHSVRPCRWKQCISPSNSECLTLLIIQINFSLLLDRIHWRESIYYLVLLIVLRFRMIHHIIKRIIENIIIVILMMIIICINYLGVNLKYFFVVNVIIVRSDIAHNLLLRLRNLIKHLLLLLLFSSLVKFVCTTVENQKSTLLILYKIAFTDSVISAIFGNKTIFLTLINFAPLNQKLITIHTFHLIHQYVCKEIIVKFAIVDF